MSSNEQKSISSNVINNLYFLDTIISLTKFINSLAEYPLLGIYEFKLFTISNHIMNGVLFTRQLICIYLISNFFFNPLFTAHAPNFFEIDVFPEPIAPVSSNPRFIFDCENNPLK